MTINCLFLAREMIVLFTADVFIGVTSFICSTLDSTSVLRAQIPFDEIVLLRLSSTFSVVIARTLF